MIQKNWKQFKKIFFKQCCQLIMEVKADLKPKYLSEKKYSGKGIKKEDLITQDYVESINKLVCKKNFDLRASSGSNQRSGVAYDEIVNPDITFETNNLHNKTYFECKILGDNSKYIKDGLYRFVIERYSLKKMPFYGMLGYVEKETASNRYKKLKSSINKKKKDLILKKETKKKNSDNEVVFDTVHGINSINKNNKKITITHILHSWEDN